MGVGGGGEWGGGGGGGLVLFHFELLLQSQYSWLGCHRGVTAVGLKKHFIPDDTWKCHDIKHILLSGLTEITTAVRSERACVRARVVCVSGGRH